MRIKNVKVETNPQTYMQELHITLVTSLEPFDDIEPTDENQRMIFAEIGQRLCEELAKWKAAMRAQFKMPKD